MKVTFLILLTRFPYKTCALRVCYPNSQSVLNGRICHCSNLGHWVEPWCYTPDRRQTDHRKCTPGQITLQGCNRCLCQENGQLTCTEDATCAARISHTSVHESLSTVMPWCSPYRTYYFKCNICICPATGKSSESHCAIDTSCTSFKEPSLTEMIFKKTNCIPTVMYLFSCLHCLCSDEGHFSSDKCVKTCVGQSHASHRCNPKSIYRKDCNVCFCPETGISDIKLCTNATCNDPLGFESMRSLKIKQTGCTPYTFTKPKCVYCDCNRNGKIDEGSCLKHECLASERSGHENDGESCIPGEVASLCTECFCPRNGTTTEKFCSKTCTYSSKLKVLENIIVSPDIRNIVDQEVLNRNDQGELCNPQTVYSDKGKYCLCPDTGRICTKNDCESVVTNSTQEQQSHRDDKFTCEPLTYYEVDCNVCLCPRDGIKNVVKCTKNDCEKSLLRSDGCVPGQLFSTECNVCVCPPNGNIAERACTTYTCNTVPWSKIFQLSERLLGNQITEDETRKLDFCFPGEEYFDGCKLCQCPDMGLRTYATCSSVFCDEEKREIDGDRHEVSNSHESTGSNRGMPLYRKLSGNREDCTIVNYTTALKRRECTPGSTYIVGCKQCYCPLHGDIRFFCRPMPEGVYCEQPYPGFDYVPMGRRTEKDNSTAKNGTHEDSNTENRHEPIKTNQTVWNSTANTILPMANITLLMANTTLPIVVKHEHTRYECKKHGPISDDCFICVCDGEALIAEHCFQSNSTQCIDATPTFLQGYVKPTSTPTAKSTDKLGGETKKP
ncbi:hypothetical protein NE865_08233 [Phthorimaea operculella]|nr:hypothetical protein NE865_08233 [Phthorimaea operculella]